HLPRGPLFAGAARSVSPRQHTRAVNQEGHLHEKACPPQPDRKAEEQIDNEQRAHQGQPPPRELEPRPARGGLPHALAGRCTRAWVRLSLKKQGPSFRKIVAPASFGPPN